MKVLVVNPGSTTVKYKLFNNDTNLLTGQIESREQKLISKIKKVSGDYTWEISPEEFNNPVKLIIKEVSEFGFELVGFRVVHGGDKLIRPTRITQDVITEIENLSSLAPLHNPPAVKIIRQFFEQTTLPMFAVFDTSFHATLPPKAFTYALPIELYQKHKIRRYGFHGISHNYVTQVLKKLEPSAKKIISMHLGGGASITAIHDGQSIDTSMGFTPLEGLVMATRTGDLDAGIVQHIITNGIASPEELTTLLNHRSGLLGISNQTSDMRELLEKRKAGDLLAKLAIEVYVYRIQKYIGAYASVLGGVDALVFTAGVGSGSDQIRDMIVEPLEWLGFKIDKRKNNGKVNVEFNLEISAKASKSIWIIPTQEELQIAQEINNEMKS